MRITGGKAKGILLKVPPGDKTRPATDYLREAIFSSLGRDWSEKSFLDLFAGTGAYGLEAISHSASQGLFVEKNSKVCSCIQENLTRVAKSIPIENYQTAYQIIKSDVIQWSREKTYALSSSQFDLVFLDPPYELWQNLKDDFLSQVSLFLKQSPESRLIVEAPGEMVFNPHPTLELIKRIGKGKQQPCAFIFKKSLTNLAPDCKL